MINKLKDWRLLLLVSAVLCYGLILLTMVNDFYELPNDAFSKEVYLRDYQKLDTYESYDDKSFASGPLEDGFYILVNDGNQLIYETYSQRGELINSDVLKENQETVLDISTLLEGSELTYVLATETTISKGVIDLEARKLLKESTISDGYDLLELRGDKTIYSQEGIFYYYDKDRNILFEDTAIKKFDYAVKDEMLYISTITRHAGSFYTDLYRVNLQDGSSDKTFVRDYITSNSTKDAAHKIILDGNYLKAMSVFRDNRFSNTFYKELTINLEEPTDFEFYRFEMADFPNFTYLESTENHVEMMIEKFTFVGKDELASANNTFRNLVLLTRDGDVLETQRMTKMKKAHPIYNYFQADDHNYLVFNTVESATGKIYFASNQADVIAMSNTLDSESFRGLILGALTVIPAALAVGFIPTMGYLFPVIFIIMPISMIKITWAERYPKKMLMIAIGIYFVSLFGGFYESAMMILRELQDMSGTLPWHMQSVVNMYGMLAITFALSYIAYKWFETKNPKSSFMIHFGVMFITQSVLYILLFNAYPLLAN